MTPATTPAAPPRALYAATRTYSRLFIVGRVSPRTIVPTSVNTSITGAPAGKKDVGVGLLNAAYKLAVLVDCGELPMAVTMPRLNKGHGIQTL